MFSNGIKTLLIGTSVFMMLLTTGCGSSPSSISKSPPPQPLPRVTVTVSPSNATALRGETQQFAAQVAGATDQTVTWKTDVGSVDGTGLYTAPTGGKDGTSATVTATSVASSSASGNGTVYLTPASVAIVPSAISVVPGGMYKFTDSVSNLPSNEVTWAVQGTAAGTITSTGTYKAPPTAGLYSVSATSVANLNYNAIAPVLVTTTPAQFSLTGSPTAGREFHTATLLMDGKVLVAGGGHEANEYSCEAGIASAELYDPLLGSFSVTASMTDLRYAQTATLLPSGKVLIAGGFSYDPIDCVYGNTSPALASAELYDPSTGSFAPTGSMQTARGVQTATLLSGGKVLIVGGGSTGGSFPPLGGTGLATAELYDPSTGAFTPTGRLSVPREGPTATLLADGRVLIAGGLTNDSGIPLASAELYDPLTGSFANAGTMTAGRAGHTATLLANGKVLITGGFSDLIQTAVGTAEIYDPATASFAATSKPMVVARLGHTATLLPDGGVLLVGGGSLVAEVYVPASDSFAPTGLTNSERSGHTATLLNNGRVLIVGGFWDYFSAELTQ